MVPIPWAYHSPDVGFHDFTGPRDLPHLFEEVEEAGLWLIPHVGPWVGSTLDGGGIPAWIYRLPSTRGVCGARLPDELPPALVRHLTDWWDQLVPLLRSRSNLIATIVDPGICSNGRSLGSWIGPLLDLLRERGIGVPCVVPETASQAWGKDLLPLVRIRMEPDPPGDVPLDARGVALMDVTGDSLGAGGQRTQAPNGTGATDLRLALATPFAHGMAISALAPAHAGVRWGWWGIAGSPATSAGGPLVGEGGALGEAYYGARRIALSLETMGTVLADSGPAYDVHATPDGHLIGARSGPDGAVAFLDGGHGEAYVALSLGAGDDAVVVEDIPMRAGSSAVLPLNWRLVESRLISTSLEPVLHTLVAGRELLVLQNDEGGEVLLPPNFRPRHRRGGAYVERLEGGLLVHFDPGRLGSVVLDGDQGSLQLLALDPRLAARTWPMDDMWRKTPFCPAAWAATADEPARGVVIGPDFVLPRRDGSYRFLAARRGFGYRWGPWRGSDPHTWLAPINWPAPEPVRFPALSWESRPGAPEALPGYDDLEWRTIVSGEALAMERQGIDYGFAWYRAHFEGTPVAVTLACRHACDLFLNGAHIAALSPPPELGPAIPKTLPLPSRHLLPQNVLSILVENQGRAMPWDAASEPHGLISCHLHGEPVSRWCVRAGLSGELRMQGFYGFADWDLVGEGGAPDITWHRSRFDLFVPRDTEVPVYLVLDRTPAKCYVYLNGMLIGRTGHSQEPLHRFWLPDGVLHRTGPNELLIAQWTRGAKPGLGAARLEGGAPLAQLSEKTAGV